MLKLNSLNLTDVLASVSDKEIDAQDRFGRTALWWAVLRNEASTLSMLIQKGANANLASRSGKSPLSIALARSHACAPVLLSAGADVSTPDGIGVSWPKLVLAASSHCPDSILKQILLQDGRIDVTAYGNTALMAAAQVGHIAACQYLIQRSADKNITNGDGECALHLAICYKRSEIVRLLLAHNAHHHLKTKGGESLLHYAAMYGDTNCLDVLQSFNLQGIGPEDVITSSSPVQESSVVVGCTAFQIGEHRSDTTPEWRKAFHKLLQVVEAANSENQSRRGGTELQERTVNTAGSTSVTDVGVVDEFEDALEYHVQQSSLPVNHTVRARSRTF